jgi:hypothetical protein
MRMIFIKKASERAELALRSMEEKFGGKNMESAHISAIANNEDVIAPFLCGCSTKNSKLILISVTSLQKLISRNAISTVLFNYTFITKSLLFMFHTYFSNFMKRFQSPMY